MENIDEKMINEMWENLLTFRHKGMLTLKNLDNHLPTESWDSMYHTGYSLIIEVLRYNRTGDASILGLIHETLDTIIEQGINFRGFNSEGEYWADYMKRNYYDKWHDKEVFRDTSRDQILNMNLGLFFIHEHLSAKDKNAEEKKEILKIHEKNKKIVHMAVEILEKNDYDLGTTYGNCKTFQVPFSLLYSYIDKDIKIEPNKKSERYFKMIPYLVSIWETKRQYFSYELILFNLILIHKCSNTGKGIYSEKFFKRTKKGLKRFIKSRVKDDNLFFELMYYYITGEFIKERNFKKELDAIFQPFLPISKPKIQDFIWERAKVNRYRPWEDWKNFYAPWGDYLIIYELLHHFKIMV